jgi:alpha-tubulin suppressor-like RCC1 family protein
MKISTSCLAVILALAAQNTPSFAQSLQLRNSAQTLRVSAPGNPGNGEPGGGDPGQEPGTGEPGNGSGAPGAGQGVPYLSAQSFEFGEVPTNTATKVQVLLTNTGQSSFALTAAPSVSGAAAFYSDKTSCGASVTAGASCLTDVVFAPTEVGAVTGSLSFSTSVPGLPAPVIFKGTGYNPLSLSAAQLPPAQLDNIYNPYAFSSRLTVINEYNQQPPGAVYTSAGTLPAGMAITNGVLTGTPTVPTSVEGVSFQVNVAYKNNTAQQTYSIRVVEDAMQVLQVIAPTGNSCALTPTGAVYCWGQGGWLMGDNGTAGNKTTPKLVPGLETGAAGIFSGYNHICVLMTAGGVKCWGGNASGQLGLGTVALTYVPKSVLGLSGRVNQLAMGGAHTCALLDTGAVQCWGENGAGQLGNGSLVDSSTPVTVIGLTNATAVYAGDSTTCAILTDHSARCWGSNWRGQMGNGTGANTYSTPTAVPALVNVKSFSMGNEHTCALFLDRSVKCTGSNSEGQVGNGTSVQSLLFVQAVGLQGNVESISSAPSTAGNCAVLTGGAVKCWGYNNSGLLGTGNKATQYTPASVVGLSGPIQAVAMGLNHTCAVTVGGVAKCWGAGSLGQLGRGSLLESLTPVNVTKL